MSYYIHTTDYKFRHIYDINRLQEYFRYADRDIERCKEIIEKIKQYQEEVKKHIETVKETPKKYVVIIRRNKSLVKKGIRILWLKPSK